MTNAADWLPLFRTQVMQWTLQPSVFLLGENDSTDGTADILHAWSHEDVRVRWFSFTPDPPRTAQALARVASLERFAYFAGVWNRVIDESLRHPWDFAYLTSVQKFTPPDVVRRLVAYDLDVVAPMLMFGEAAQPYFYETHCTFSDAGTMFRHTARLNGNVERVQAVGGTHCVRRAVFASGCRQAATHIGEGETVPFCREAIAQGYAVWLDRSLQTHACWELSTMQRYLDHGPVVPAC